MFALSFFPFISFSILLFQEWVREREGRVKGAGWVHGEGVMGGGKGEGEGRREGRREKKRERAYSHSFFGTLPLLKNNHKAKARGDTPSSKTINMLLIK
jgi:hypothetical protein